MAEQLDLFADNFTDGGAVEWTDAALDEKLDRISNALAQSPTGRALLEWAADNDVVVVFDAQLSASYAASYRPQSNAVVMSPHTDEDFLVSLLAHELRHAWQHDRGLLPFDPSFAPEDFVVHSRYIEADAIAHQMQVAAELSGAGDDGPLIAVMYGEPAFFETYGNAIESFTRAATLDGDALENGNAMLAAFQGWFASHARDDYNDLSVMRHHQMLKIADRHMEETGVVMAGDKPDLADAAKLAAAFPRMDGKSYLSGLPEDFTEYDEVSDVGVDLESENADAYFQAWRLHEKLYGAPDARQSMFMPAESGADKDEPAREPGRKPISGRGVRT